MYQVATEVWNQIAETQHLTNPSLQRLMAMPEAEMLAQLDGQALALEANGVPDSVINASQVRRCRRFWPTQSNQPVYQPDGELQPTPGATGSVGGQGSRSDSPAGSAIERQRADAVTGNAETAATELAERKAAQRAANSLPPDAWAMRRESNRPYRSYFLSSATTCLKPKSVSRRLTACFTPTVLVPVRQPLAWVWPSALPMPARNT